MRTDDIKKLVKAGYTIVRADDYPKPRIKTYGLSRGKRGVWLTLDNYDTKAARDRALAKMLEDDKTILD